MYALLEQAPPDHLSEEFMQFIRENNKVVADMDHWLVIENCKYHTPYRPWWTAFYKHDTNPTWVALSDLMCFLPDGMSLKKHIKEERSVQRLHYHLYQ